MLFYFIYTDKYSKWVPTVLAFYDLSDLRPYEPIKKNGHKVPIFNCSYGLIAMVKDKQNILLINF